MKENIDLYLNLKKIMKKKNISQSDLAKSLNVSRSDICLTLKALSNGKSIHTSKLFSILKALDSYIEMITNN